LQLADSIRATLDHQESGGPSAPDSWEVSRPARD
jgi:hypothetical protein